MSESEAHNEAESEEDGSEANERPAEEMKELQATARGVKVREGLTAVVFRKSAPSEGDKYNGGSWTPSCFIYLVPWVASGVRTPRHTRVVRSDGAPPT